MSNSAYTGGAGIHLQNLFLDSSTTAEQKADCVSPTCSYVERSFSRETSLIAFLLLTHTIVLSLPLQLKLLKVVLKNLADPVKSQDPKYRQLKTSNPKIQTKILPCPSALDYLKAIGFEEVEGGGLLKVENVPDLVLMKASFQEVCNALDMVSPKDEASTASAPKKPRVVVAVDEDEKKESFAPERLSEKQKARILMEAKEKRDREEAKAVRKRNVALLKADKFVRENDENWTSGQSAACVKSGTGISTFRDRFGE